jgi:hypothetical protein
VNRTKIEAEEEAEGVHSILVQMIAVLYLLVYYTFGLINE